MYHKKNNQQVDVYDFILPFGGHLNEDNRWVKLRQAIDWDVIDEEYSKNFTNKDHGNEAYPSEVAFGALYIQRKYGYTDRELVDQIAENPYLQYFIGFKEYRNERPFDPSLLVSFRNRISLDMMDEIMNKTFVKLATQSNQHDNGKEDCNSNDDKGNKDGNNGIGCNHDEETSNDNSTNSSKVDGEKCSINDNILKFRIPEIPPNIGTLIIDATCAPADIAYPTDLELCDKARKWAEIIFDHLWSQHGSLNDKKTKPKTYRNKAHKRFLKFNKRRKKSAKKIRKEIRYQLNCIKRNLGYIEEYEKKYGLDCLFHIEQERLATIKIFYNQQKEMYDNKTHTVADRIVSLSQPWIRPIVRGKSKAPTEFGAKISISVVNGYTFIDRISFDAYNEGDHDEFVGVVEMYRKRFGCYPERILADKIYRSKANRHFCKLKGIRISGPKLGRPGKTHDEDLRQESKEIGERNAVEGKFGNCKRKLGLSRIMAKLENTTKSMIAMDFFILNMERLLRQKSVLFYTIFESGILYMKSIRNNNIYWIAT